MEGTPLPIGDGNEDEGWWEDREAQKYEMLLVEIHGLSAPVEGQKVDGGVVSIDANGLKGRAIDWSTETELYCVFTFDGLYLNIAEANLREYSPPPAQEGGFDACWPYYIDNTFFDFCADVNNSLLAKNYCLIQMSKNEEARQEALSKAKRKDFEVPKDEFLGDFLGRKGKGKVSRIDPLTLLAPDEVDTLPEPKNELDIYDMEITNLFATMGPMTWDSQNFNSAGRTQGMVWLPFASGREEVTLTPEPLNDEDIEEEGLVEKHLHFIRRRKLCFLYLIDTEGGSVALYPKDDPKGEAIEMPAEKGRLLVFRCDKMAFKYQPQGDHFTLMSWVLTDPPKLEVGSVTASSKNLDDLFGVHYGPSIPLGERAHIMALACLTGGGVHGQYEAESMYLSGTDAHVYVPFNRFDTDIYFTKDADNDLVPYQNSYHHHGGLLYDDEILSFDNHFFGIDDSHAEIMWPNQRKLLEVGYDVLYNAGFTKKSVHGQPIIVYLGDIGGEWWTKVQDRMWRGEHCGDSGSSLNKWHEVKDYGLTGMRISYEFGLRGGAWITDTACSSGLTAFCTAMYSIKRPTERGTESPSMNMHARGAIAGGVNLITDPAVYVGNCAQHMLSVKGRCFTFDTTSDGYARGEGCSLAYATNSADEKETEMQDACAIGNKVNQDGKSASMTAPNGPSQQMCIKASLREAGVMPHEIMGSECHGTGTALGDPIEVGSLRGVQETDEREGPMVNTSSKSNIGHLEANAGTTGLFKCVLMGKFSAGLPNVHFRSLNPHLDITGWPTYMISEVSDINANSSLTGVSSFGVSGTNSHAEVWAMCRTGPNAAGRRFMTMDKLHQFTLTCPVTLGQIDHLTGEPAKGDGRKYHADVLRGELADYDVSTLAYDGDFRYRREALADDDELVNPDNVRVCICGSWSGWNQIEKMELQEDGSFMHTVCLGDSKFETFYLCLNENTDFRMYPVMNNASPKIWIDGPDNKGVGKRWIIDRRNEKVSGVCVYQIRFRWGQEKKSISWEEVSEKFAAECTRYERRYQIKGSWSSWMMHDMVRDEEGAGKKWEYTFRIGSSGEEAFQLCRDNDEQQLIYPARPDAVKPTDPVRGPDDLGKGKHWLVRGKVDEAFNVCLEVGTEGKLSVTIANEAKGEKVWESLSGWQRHDYWVAFQDGPCTKMEMDKDTPGLFRCRGTVRDKYDEKFRGFCEFFSVVVDEEPSHGFYPDVGFATKEECIVRGPDGEGDGRLFTLKSWQVGAEFEIILDLNAVDRRKIVTWKWDKPPTYTFTGGIAVLDG